MRIQIHLFTLMWIGNRSDFTHVCEAGSNFHFDAGPDPDPVSYESDANLRPLVLLKKKKNYI
jgi:hypothetical protein